MGVRVFVVAVGLLALLALGPAPAFAQQDDPRAEDAVDFFGGMCGRIIANWEPPVDHERYRAAWLSQRQLLSITDGLEDLAVWMVVAPDSDAHMLQYVTHGGVCGVEVEVADRRAIDQAFERLVQMATKALSLKATVRMDETSEGVRTRTWRLGPAATGYDIALSSSDDGSRSPQFIMTMAEAPEDEKSP